MPHLRSLPLILIAAVLSHAVWGQVAPVAESRPAPVPNPADLRAAMELNYPDIRPETRQRPDTPWQVRVAFGSPSTTSLMVTWQVQREVAGSLVEYGPSPTLGLKAPAKRVVYKSQTGVTYEAALDQLLPATAIFYRVGTPGAWSETFTATTAPKSNEPFVFTAFGDHGVLDPAPQNLAAITRDNPAFHVLLGDVSYANGFQPFWDKWFDMMEPFASRIPVMAAIGNHEYEKDIGPMTYVGRFSFPEDELQYTFDYGNVRFVVVNTVLGLPAPQLAWLEAALAKARADQVGWLIVCQHFPLFGTTAGRGFNRPLIVREAAVLEKYRVDLVLAGHDHVYERSFPILGGKPVSQERERYRKGVAPIHVIAGGGGAGLYKFAPRPSSLNAIRELTHARLRVTVRAEGPLEVEAIRLDGSTLDHFEIAP